MRDWELVRPVPVPPAFDLGDVLSFDDFQLAISRLVEKGLRLPYDLLPGSRPGGLVEIVCCSRWDWETYIWGGPGDPHGPDFLAHLEEFAEPDIDASYKPDWSDIVAVVQVAKLADLRDSRLQALRDEIRERRIPAAFGGDDRLDESIRRLNTDHPATAPAERTRLLAKYAQWQAWVDDPARTVEELTDFDPADDANWTP